MADKELEIKYNQEDITPFWRKLPFLFLFPFRAGPLIFMACIVGASALAGLALGPFGLLFKGSLVYLGLRYAFNVLDMFAKGRFEGWSVDYTLWGPEKRPAKLGLVITLFIVIAVNLGSFLVANRLFNDTAAQDIIVERYKRQHADEMAAQVKAREAFEKRIGIAPTAGEQAWAANAAAQAQAQAQGQGDDDDHPATPAGVPPMPGAVAEPPPPENYGGLSRAELVESNRPDFGDPLWFRLLPAWYWVFVAVLSLMLPSAALTIALEDSFWRALNPLNVIDLIQRVGSAYFVLWAFFLSIAGARHLALTFGADWSPFVRFPVEMAAGTYLGLVLFALMGYALYQFHQALHLDVEVDFDDHRKAGGAEGIAQAGSARAALREAEPQDPLERKIRPLIAAGNIKEAIAEVKDFMRYDRFDAALNTRLHGLYAMEGDSATVLAHGQQWLTALARAGQGKEVFAAYQKMLKLDAAFTVQDGDAILPAAKAASQASEHAAAANLLRNFDKRFPKHKDTPGVFFLGARILSEQSRQHDKAAKILRVLVAHFPDHDVAAEAKNYLAVLERMMAKA
ncbi:MAG TPA: hypothetical protein VLJ58_13140 [Ramlibacter sp.]|nr:hypothetical protein [Ramlibacter sp.]